MVQSYLQNYQTASCGNPSMADDPSTADNPSLLSVIHHCHVSNLFYPTLIEVSGFCALLSSKRLSALCTLLKDNNILTSVIIIIDKTNAMLINFFLSQIPH